MKNEIQERLNNLFNEWTKRVNEKFVRDGVIDIENYKNIVWLLRETNNFPGDLALLIKDCIQNEKNHQTYWKTPQTHYKKSIAVYALLNPNLSNENIRKHKKDGLKYAAVVNIKKTSGKNKSSEKEILKYLENDIDFIKKEIEILNPKIVIVGGMKSYKNLNIKKKFKLEKLENYVYKSQSGIIFLETHHPSYPLIKWDKWIDFFKYVGKKYLKQV